MNLFFSLSSRVMAPVLLALILSLPFWSSGCAGRRKITFMAYQPPDYDVSLIRKIGLIPLEAENPEAARLFEARFIQDLMKHGYFSVIEAGSAESIATNGEPDITSIGSRLGVEAVLIGQVDGEVSDRHSTQNGSKRVLTRYRNVEEYETEPVRETVKVKVMENGKWVEKTQTVTVMKRVLKKKQVPEYEQISYTEKYLDRNGSLTVSVRLIDVASGQVLASRSATKQEHHRKLISTTEPPDEGARVKDSSFGGLLSSIIETIAEVAEDRRTASTIPDRATILGRMAAVASRELADQFSPRQISVVRQFQSNEATDRGVRYARNGQWDQAGREWRKVRDLYPENGAAWNNLGIYYEREGQFAEARRSYEQAMTLQAGSRVVRQNFSALNALISSLQKQTASLGAKIEETTLGLMIASVLEGTLAERIGLRKGDIITRINGSTMNTLDAIEQQVTDAARLGGTLAVEILRAGEPISLSLSFPDRSGRVVAAKIKKEDPSEGTDFLPVVDVDQVIPSRINRPDALGVIIGVEDYRYAPSVPYARHDALVANAYFVRALGIKESNIYMRTDRDATQGEFRKIFDPVQGWLARRVKPEKTEIFVYFVGHGAPDPSTRDAYLMPTDGDPNYPSTGYRLDELYNSLGQIPARQITVMIDACFSGLIGRGARVEMIMAGARGVGVEPRRSGLAPNLVVLTASQGNQVSSSYPEKAHGLFTYFLFKGLQNHADQNSDSEVTVAELYDYVRTQVQTQAGHLDREQTPELFGSDTNRVLVRY